MLIYLFIIYVCVCVCFNVILISEYFKWTLFLQFQHQNLYTHFLYLVCVTFLKQCVNIYCKARKILLAIQITKHLIV